MEVLIGTPAKRSLTPNEKRVYELLRDGLEPQEISRRLRMLLKCPSLINCRGVPPDTVMGLITSIREKGWEIPENNNKEENEMPKGTKTPAETVYQINALRAEGKTIAQISEMTGTPKSTVTRVCAKLGETGTEKEPAPSVNGTSPKENNHNIIVAEKSGDVKPREEIPGIVLDALTDTLENLYANEREIREVLENLKRRIEANNVHRSENLKKISELRKYIRGIGYGDVLTALDAARKQTEQENNN